LSLLSLLFSISLSSHVKSPLSGNTHLLNQFQRNRPCPPTCTPDPCPKGWHCVLRPFILILVHRRVMFSTTVILLSLLATTLAIVDPDGPIDPIGPIHPVSITNFQPLPPHPRTCVGFHCPPGFHCVMRQMIFCIDPPCNFPRQPTCVRNPPCPPTCTPDPCPKGWHCELHQYSHIFYSFVFYQIMFYTTYILLALLTFSCSLPIEPIEKHPIDPIPPVRCPPTCTPDPCPKGYHCEL
ncbi:hypothetical protein PENTCL1PPCAC_19730, partial [Pristionchus entomophagus]